MRPGSGLLQPDHDVHEGSRFLAIPVDRQHTCHHVKTWGAPRAWRGTSATASFQQDGRRTGNGTRRGGRGTGERDLAGEQETGRGAGDGEQENGIWQENRNRDAALGDGEQENGIWQENK